MNKQCGNCKWWDRDNLITNQDKIMFSECQAKVPFWVTVDYNTTSKTEGQDCIVYEERKE